MNGSGLGARLIPVAIGLIGVLFFAAKGCEEGPFGRKQIVGMSPADELKLGIQANREILGKANVVSGRPINDVVKDVGLRLARASEDPTLQKLFGVSKEQAFQWEFNVVGEDQVNAFCLPGGKVVVYTGILPVCQTDTGLAVVMGHEIGHALARHGSERMGQQQMAQFGQIAVAGGLMSPDMSPAQRQMIMGALSAGTQIGLLKYSRNQESEADHIGILLMAAAGYDPREAAKFWVRMGEKSGGGARGPAFLATHPEPGDRSRALQQWADGEAMAYFNRSPSKVTAKPLPGVSGVSPRPTPELPRRPDGSPKSPRKGDGWDIPLKSAG